MSKELNVPVIPSGETVANAITRRTAAHDLSGSNCIRNYEIEWRTYF